ncbi:hypothetical protein CKA32_006994 [Geitlerinema sp. FC II]|nr:hypothetical protein CKA32_006994 [Geitlerinema sp. FC II]
MTLFIVALEFDRQSGIFGVGDVALPDEIWANRHERGERLMGVLYEPFGSTCRLA